MPPLDNAASGPRDHTKRYVVIVGSAMVSALACVALTNVIVDPHGIFRLVDAASLNRIKPRATQSVRAFKYRAIEALRPRTLILGNSRAEMGLNPAKLVDAGFGPTVNAAIPGAGLGAMVPIADFAWQVSQPDHLVIGVEFFDCLEAGARPEPARSASSPWPAHAASLAERLPWIRLATADALSLDSFFDSLATVLAQHRPDAPDLRSDGFQPARDYPRMVRLDGARKMFLQREQETIKLRSHGPQRIRYTDGSPSSCFNNLAQLADAARLRKQRVHVILYPYHARLLEIIWHLGLWPAYEDWKRETSNVVEALRLRGAQITLQDFGGYHTFASEPVSPHAAPRWYWESGHFKASLGDLIVRSIQSGDAIDVLFGTPISGNNIEPHLAAVRRSRAAFVANQPEVPTQIAAQVSKGSGAAH